MSSGRQFARIFPSPKQSQKVGDHGQMIAAAWRGFCGFFGPVLNGALCLKNMAVQALFTAGFANGLRMKCSSIYGGRSSSS
jgi:hypothetical protein